MATTAIEWTDAVWNPTTGCDRVSPGCDNCYALTQSKRLKAMGQPKYQTDGDPRTSGPGFGLAVHPDTLDQPLRWRKPRRVFVNSMSDLFHPKVTDEFIARVFAVMAATPQHTYQVLTKRPARMRSLVGNFGFEVVATLPGSPWPLPNVWLGTSVEDQERADQRIPHLLDTPAAIRFLSCEPLLGGIDLRPWLFGWGCAACGYETGDLAEMRRDVNRSTGGVTYLVCPVCRREGEFVDRQPGIDWVIVGGESGPGARPMHPAWPRKLRDQCLHADVAFFMKQLGSAQGHHHHNIDAFPPDLRIREFPAQDTPS